MSQYKELYEALKQSQLYAKSLKYKWNAIKNTECFLESKHAFYFMQKFLLNEQDYPTILSKVLQLYNTLNLSPDGNSIFLIDHSKMIFTAFNQELFQTAFSLKEYLLEILNQKGNLNDLMTVSGLNYFRKNSPFSVTSFINTLGILFDNVINATTVLLEEKYFKEFQTNDETKRWEDELFMINKATDEFIKFHFALIPQSLSDLHKQLDSNKDAIEE